MIGRGEWKKGSDWEKEEWGKKTIEWGEAKERPQSHSPGHCSTRGYISPTWKDLQKTVPAPHTPCFFTCSELSN